MLPPPISLPLSDHVVGARAHAAGIRFEARGIRLERRGERVMHEFPPLLVLQPVEHREVHDPEELVAVRVEQVLALRDVQAELAEHAAPSAACAPGGHQQQIGRAGARRASSARRIASSPAALSAGLCTTPSAWRAQTSPAAPSCFASSIEVVEILARVARRVRHDESAHFAAGLDRAAEDREARRGERLRQVLQLHPRTQVRLVGPVASRSPRSTASARNVVRRLASDQRHQPPHQRLEHREDEVLGRERDLEVDLRELGLAIGAQVLVAEALRDLEVAIDARDHQDLLEDLRRLRQREELPRVHAARHQVVARPFGRRLRQDRRLDLEKALLVEVAGGPRTPSCAAGSCSAAGAAGAGRDSGSAAASLRRPACLR